MRIAIVHADEQLILKLAQLVSIEWPEAEIEDFAPENCGRLGIDPRSFDVAFVDLEAVTRLPAALPCIGIAPGPAADDGHGACVSMLDGATLSRASVTSAMRQALAALDRPSPDPMYGDIESADPAATQCLDTLTDEECASIRIKGYRVFKRIGRGGMATVYLGEKLDTHEPVAIKILDAKLSEDDGQLKRFMQEFNLHSKIRSKYVARIFEHGFTDDNIYIVMEYFPGGDMKPMLGRPIEPRQALGFLHRLGIALEDIHRQGVVHRDVKPQNIMFREDGSIALMDFGVSRATDWSWSLTLPGEVVGTPYYMSPEQGAAEEVDARSDLYSLGAIFFEMLTGEKPYAANSLVALLYMHANEPVPVLPKALAVLQPVIEKTMAKDPADRFGSAAELLNYIRVRWSGARKTPAEAGSMR